VGYNSVADNSGLSSFV